MPRQGIGKKLRFEVFRRDAFMCRYCGAQPPDVLLVIDHVIPVMEGGDNHPDNLATACEACNQGKGATLLASPGVCDETDLRQLAMLQEVLELRKFQEWKQRLDEERAKVIEMLQDAWCDCSGLEWCPNDQACLQLISRFEPRLVLQAFESVAPKVAAGIVRESGWLRYLWGCCNTIEQEGE